MLEDLPESDGKLIQRVLREIEIWKDGAGEAALEYDAQLVLCNTKGKPTSEEVTVDQFPCDTEVYLPQNGSRAIVDPNFQEGKGSPASYLSLLRIVRANESFSDDEKDLLQTEIEHTEKCLAASENTTVDTADKCHLRPIQAICDSLVARHSITMAIRVRFSVLYTCTCHSLCGLCS
jgi:hypothetical protein